MRNKTFDELSKLRDKAFDLRNNGGLHQDSSEDLKKAAELFQVIIENEKLQLKLYMASKENTNYILLYSANLHHIEYEYYTCLHLYEYKNGSNRDMLKYLDKAKSSIDLAIKKLKKIDMSYYSSLGNVGDIKYDILRWTYYSKRIKAQYIAAEAEILFSEKRLGEAYDTYDRAIIENAKLLILTKEFIDYLEPQHLRVVESNHAILNSNYNYVYHQMLENHLIDDDIFVEVIKKLYDAYKYSIKAVKIFPEGVGASRIAQLQKKDLVFLLKKHKRKWPLIIQKLNCDEDFTLILNEIDKRKYSKMNRGNHSSFLFNGVKVVLLIAVSLLVCTYIPVYFGIEIDSWILYSVVIVIILTTLLLSNYIDNKNYSDLIESVLNSNNNDL